MVQEVGGSRPLFHPYLNPQEIGGFLFYIIPVKSPVANSKINTATKILIDFKVTFSNSLLPTKDPKIPEKIAKTPKA